MSQTVSESLLLGLLLVSLCVWIGVVRQWTHESRWPIPYRMRRRPVRHRLVVWMAITWIAYQLVFILAATASDTTIEPSLVVVQGSCVTNAIIFALFAFLLARTSQYHPRDLGMSFRPTWTDMTAGVLGFFASMLPVTVVLIGLNQLGALTPENQHSFLLLLQDRPDPTAVLWIELAVVVFAPLTEELLFRVILQGWLESWMRGSRAVFISAVCFSIVHGWPNAAAIFPLALVLGYVYHRRHNMCAVVLLHALFNASNLIRALLTPWIDGGLPQ